MEVCPFCDLAQRRLLVEEPLVVAFEDDFPVSRGHALVVPRRHVATYFDCTLDERAALWDLVVRVRNLIVDGCRPDGFNVGYNAGAAAGQTVMHAHVHVIPRYSGDVADPRGRGTARCRRTRCLRRSGPRRETVPGAVHA